MSDRRWLWRNLNLPLGAATAASIGLHLAWPAGGFWINLATTLIGSIVAVNYIDRVVQRRAQLEWRGATELIAHRLQHTAFATITNVRAAVGLSARHLGIAQIDLNDKTAFLTLCASQIEPLLGDSVRRLNQAGWSKLGEALQVAYRDFQDALTLFGGKLRPADFRRILQIQDDIRSVLALWSAFPDVLGVEDVQLPASEGGDLAAFKRSATADLAARVSGILTSVRQFGEAAIALESQVD
jgi:hypothetical protein